MSKLTCCICKKNLSFWNQPIFGKGVLLTFERVCSSCFLKINRKSPKVANNLKKHEFTFIEELLQDKPEKTEQINLRPISKVNSSPVVENNRRQKDNPSKKVTNKKWEIVHRKTKRWRELGFENTEAIDDQLFKRDFEYWYCNINSKEKHGIDNFQDTSKYIYDLPKLYKKITGLPLYSGSQLGKTPTGFECVHSGHDKKNNIRWYFGLKKSERIKGQDKVDNFPGYGRLYDRSFKVWYCDIGSKEPKNEQSFNDRFPLHYGPRDYENITGENVYLERLDNTKGYDSLYSGLDNKNRKRWYFALIQTTPIWIEAKRAIENEDTV